MPKEIVRPIPEKSTGQFSPDGPEVMDLLKTRGTLRFEPSPKLADMLATHSAQRTYGRHYR